MSSAIIVTGGAGFIGSAVIQHLLAHTDDVVVNLDKLTYAANLDALAQFEKHPRYRFVKACITDADALRMIFDTHRPRAVMHLAAESHVDRSIDGPARFHHDQHRGHLHPARGRAGLSRRVARALWREQFRFHHVSTDEVFGSLGPDGLFHEESPYSPNSPYSASKASSDHFVRAWHATYGVPAVMSNCSNNYGPVAVSRETDPVDGPQGPSVTNRCQFMATGRRFAIGFTWMIMPVLWKLILSRGKLGESYNVGRQFRA
jgi:dTDP-glucose 4,6-dehydratase